MCDKGCCEKTCACTVCCISGIICLPCGCLPTSVCKFCDSLDINDEKGRHCIKSMTTGACEKPLNWIFNKYLDTYNYLFCGWFYNCENNSDLSNQLLFLRNEIKKCNSKENKDLYYELLSKYTTLIESSENHNLPTNICDQPQNTTVNKSTILLKFKNVNQTLV